MHVYTKLYPKLWRSAARKLPWYAVGDVVHDTMVIVLEKGHLVDPENLEPWARGVLRHRIAHWYRPQRRWADVDVATLSAPAGDVIAGFAARWIPVLMAVAALEPSHAEILRIYYLEGMTAREIAAFLGIPEGTVRGRIASALRRVRQEQRRLARERDAAWQMADTRAEFAAWGADWPVAACA